MKVALVVVLVVALSLVAATAAKRRRGLSADFDEHNVRTSVAGTHWNADSLCLSLSLSLSVSAASVPASLPRRRRVSTAPGQIRGQSSKVRPVQPGNRRGQARLHPDRQRVL